VRDFPSNGAASATFANQKRRPACVNHGRASENESAASCAGERLRPEKWRKTLKKLVAFGAEVNVGCPLSSLSPGTA
jgi:hypothetical protein